MPDLIYYLERNSFFPRREDVEAILRRCDHDANRSISYSEFSELASSAHADPARPEADQLQVAEDENEDAEDKDDAAGEDGAFNDRVEEVDDDEELRQGPSEQRQQSADKNQSSA